MRSWPAAGEIGLALVFAAVGVVWIAGAAGTGLYTFAIVSTEAVQELPASVEEHLVHRKRLAIVPALNEEQTIARVIAEIRAVDPGFAVVVVDDGSSDRSRHVAEAAGALVLQLPFNLGIGGAMLRWVHPGRRAQ